MEWKFRKLTPNDTKGNPSHLEFFRNEELHDIVDALVREDIQNRLDARADNWPVRVSYRIEHEGIPSSRSQEWFNRLFTHLNSREVIEELREEPFLHNRPVPFLVMEDFNTTGLRGNPAQTEDPAPLAARNDFYWFVRNVGRSNKKAGDRGRWGLGKIVYPASSRIRSFFALSVSVDNSLPSLIGRSVLTIHRISEGEFDSEGYFGEFLDPDYEYFSMPSTDIEITRRFRSDFKITRSDKERGLSLVIPFPEESITLESLIKSLITHYLWEILANRLVVSVSSGEKAYELRGETLRDFVRTWSGFQYEEKIRLRNMVEFCTKADAMKFQDECYFCLKLSNGYSWDRLIERFENEETGEEARKLFREGELIACEIPVTIRNKQNNKSDVSSFMVYLQKDTNLKSSEETFIRDGLTIIGMSFLREPGVRALVVAEDPAISEFLGDAENPAHTKWLQNTKHFLGKYTSGPRILSFVKHSAARLATWLGHIEDVTLPDLLRDIFSVPEEGEEMPESGNKPGKAPRPGPGEVKTNPVYIQVRREDAGFSVQAHPKAEKTPAELRIRVAYETISGNPYSQWHPADFEFETMKKSAISLKGCEVLSMDGNRLLVSVSDRNFEMSINGFDVNRDLVVDARAIFEEEDETDDQEV